MATSEHHLPVEVWLNIFDQVQDKQQLAQCKLVCKRWAQLVEMAMLKTVVLTETNTPKLYQHLLKNPRSIRYVQVVDLSKYPINNLLHLYDFMTLVMTPSLKAIDANMCSSEFHEMLLEIVAQKPDDCIQLERLPMTTFSNDAYAALVSLLRKTLRLLVLGFIESARVELLGSVSNNLNMFERLTDLRVIDLIQYIDSVPKLDAMLKGCSHLTSLLLGVDQSPTRIATANLDTWLSQNVHKVDSVKSIFVRNTSIRSSEQDEDTSGGFYLDLLRYLSFKYPKVNDVSINLYKQKDQPIVQSLFENAETVKLQNWKVDTIDHAEQIMNVWKSQTNSLVIQYREPLLYEDYACVMNVDKVKKDNHAKLALQYILLQVPAERIQQIVASVGNTLTKFLEIDVVEYQEIDKEFSPFTFLQSTPFIDHLKVSASNLVQALPLAPLTRLHTLELDVVKLSPKDVTAIASWAPHLKHLTLKCRKFITDHRNPLGDLSYRTITLPQLDLSTLTFKGDMLSQDLCISFAIAKSRPQLYYAAPARPIVRTTLEESELYTHATESITIRCKSLKRLSVSLDDVILEMEFDEEGNVIESNPAVVDSKMTQLQQDIRDLSTENALLKTENQTVTTKYEQVKKHLTQAQIQTIEKQDI